ncbi:AMP-binding protein [Amycolatopsis sp. NPDC051102]|uniref:AMP-binding protein n=1 Tax=Amycolatopsis sp. NPDC051102 TaxID=3155163 RepID=UPI0034267F21
MTLSKLLARRAAVAGEETALTFSGARPATLTWAELDRRVSAVAASLRRVAEPGQRAAILVAPSPGYVAAFLGVLRAGLIAIPAGPHRRARVLADAQPSIVLTTADTVAATRQFLSTLDTCGHRVLAVDAVPDAPFAEAAPAPEDVAYLQYPGGVMVTHANVLANAKQAAQLLDRPVVVTWLPPSDPLGLLLGVAVPVVTGRPAVLVERREFLAGAVRAPGSAGSLVSADDPDLDRLRAAFAPGALRECYVRAEATALVACGRPAGQTVAIVGPDGRRRPPGAAGEIWVSGPNVARGYWNRPAESARVFCAFVTGDDEPRWWLRTGDLGVLDESGVLSVTGRGLVAGHDAQDLEATAEEAHPAIRPNAAAAFALSGQQAVVVLELVDGVVPPRGEVERAVRHAVSTRHGLTLRRVVVLPAGEARARHLDGDGLW